MRQGWTSRTMFLLKRDRLILVTNKVDKNEVINIPLSILDPPIASSYVGVWQPKGTKAARK